jgi:BirA family biotin operon repressor/biotin-[acetyl-CoA-carboxylase] ligase
MTAIPAPGELTFKLLRLLADGEFHSGEALAGVAGVSRTTVWKALQAAEPWGVTLYKVHGRGYRLVTPIEWLDAAVIARRLGAKAGLFDLRIEQVCGSTNTELLRAAASKATPSGTVLAAELQNAGRGRRGRTWHSPIGGALTFSLLWRFERGPAGLAGLSLAVSVGVLRALRELGAADIRLKWPNDLLWRHQKLGGILIEIDGGEEPAAVIGIGLNLRLDEQVRGRVDQAVADLASAGMHAGRNQLLAAVLAHQADVLRVFAGAGFAPLRAEWEQAHAFAGRQVVVALPDRSEHAGTVAGVADDGSLLVTTGGAVQRFHSGEVSLRPQLPQSAPSAA